MPPGLAATTTVRLRSGGRPIWDTAFWISGKAPRAISAASHPSSYARCHIREKARENHAGGPHERIGVVDGGCWLSRNRPWHPIDASAGSQFSRTRTGESIQEGSIHRGDTALEASRHCDARGGGRTDGTEC